MTESPSFSSQLDAVSRQLSDLIDVLSGGPQVAPIPDQIAAVEVAGRLMDAVRVRVLSPLVGDNVAAQQLGYSSPVAAVASIARISERSARARLAVAAATCPNTTLTGAQLPPARPIIRDALAAGDIGLDAAALVASELASIAPRTPTAVLDIAEAVMVGLAAGVDPTGTPMVTTVSVDHLAGEIRQVTAAADPDGARPREERAARRREFRLGVADDDGLLPVSGRLMPEVGNLLAGMLEAHRRSPRFLVSAGGFDSVVDSDTRTPGQRRHDALSEIVMAAANASGAPRLDGAPVTVLVTVSATELIDENGVDGDAIATMAGSRFPVSRRTVERFIDASGYRVVTVGDNGAVTGISSLQRCFTTTQRLAIVARDGARCSTPGCTSPHYALQAHHVIPDRDDGPTAIDNGILLCYWHHQQVDTGPWDYRMINGMPYVRGPGIREWTPTRKPLLRAA